MGEGTIADVGCGPGHVIRYLAEIDSAEFRTGEFRHITDWVGESVDLKAHFIDPAAVVRDLQSAGFAIRAELERKPLLDFEYPTRRSYVLAQRTRPVGTRRASGGRDRRLAALTRCTED